MQWHQGWAKDPILREKCSSGGLAAAVSAAFIKGGGVVCSCCFREGKFIFEFSESTEDLEKFIGSKYVKSDPSGVYKNIKNRLAEGQKILFIGLPCQVSGVKNFLEEKSGKDLYTIDLICHGTPSPQLLNIFLKQYGKTSEKLEKPQFRVKAKFWISDNGRGIVGDGISDRYSIAFLNALTYTENCYSCPYARAERISDLTLGDSWGSELAIEEQKKGVSLALCQTEKGIELLRAADVDLYTVDLQRAAEENHQLKSPSIKPYERGRFFRKIRTKKFNSLVFRKFPRQCLRQNVKQVLFRTKIGGIYQRRKE